MENASKALVIAGSILIGMIVISIFYFAFEQSGRLVGEVDEDTLQEEIKAFNNGFEAYNKKLMYGIDIISVLNKAIDNNKKYDVSGDEKDYFVDIEITVYDKGTIQGNDQNGGPKKLPTYILSTNYSGIKEKFLSSVSDKEPKKPSGLESDPKYKKDWEEYHIKYDKWSDAHSFKVSPFKCTKIEYVPKKGTKNLGAIR